MVNFYNEYGKGKGKCPGEFKNPTDFVIDGNYNVWVCDPANVNKTIDESPEPKIEIFSIEGKVVRGLPKGAPFSVRNLNVRDGLIFVKSEVNWREMVRYSYSFRKGVRDLL